ncbi:MAG: DUF3786 domain-containing protein, partial [Euryarchaeota archaeon]|nr:DUF3786 domain-containing protein [Euryarchaeota archaeon]
ERRAIERESGESPGPFLGVLILHYLAGCSGLVPTGRLITFREAPGGDVYYPAFRSRTIETIRARFSSDPALLRAAGERIGGTAVKMGSAGVQIPVFPKVPVTVVVWEGDDEVPGSVNLLFDETAPRILPTEDLVVVGSVVCSMLKKAV